MSRMLRTTGTVAMICAAVAAGAERAAGDGATVTRGELSELPAAQGRPEQGLTGRTQAVRTADGRTRLSITMDGLQPGVTYGVHLHNAPCSATNPGGGHYKHDPAGPAQPPNELWPSSDAHNPMAGITANAAGRAHGDGVAGWVAGGNAVSVVIHAGVGHGATTTAGGPKLACADLS